MIKKHPGRKRKRPDKGSFEMLYKTMTAAEVAAHYGVATQTIYQWAQQYRKEEDKGGGKIKIRA